MEIIRTDSLSKHFGPVKAVDDISLSVHAGEIYGFLGLNGAGKTTLIRILLGMIKADRGNVSLFDKRIGPQFPLWNEVGYLVETPNAYPNLSVRENLEVFFRLRQLKDRAVIDNIITKLKLEKYRDIKAKNLSLGNRQRLGLAKAMMHRPKLLILDEPINGLDPEGIVEVRDLLKELSEAGTGIFVSSHILGEISKVAKRMGIIHQGKLIRELTTKELENQLIKKLKVVTTDNIQAIRFLEEKDYPATLNEAGEIEISVDRAIAHPENISQLLVEKNLPPKQLFLFVEDLEMYFLRTIKGK